jgi:DNA polymerase-1
VTRRRVKVAGPGHWGVVVDGIRVIRDPELAANSLASDRVIGVDLETTGLSPWRDSIATVQLYGEDSSSLAVVQARRGEVPPPVAALLGSGKKFVVHNGVGFDLLFLNNAGVEWGKSAWHDTLVGETLLATTGRRDVSRSLSNSLRLRLGKTIDKNIEHGHWANDELSAAQVEYAAQDVISLPALYNTQLTRAEESEQGGALEMEMELMPVVVQMELNGLPCTPGRMRAYVQKQRAAIADAEVRLRRRLGAKINLSSTQQLQAVLRDKYGVPVESTNKETLMELATYDSPAGRVAEDLLTWKHGNQRIKMYSEAWIADSITNDRIHPHFKQCAADTTRFTCSDPNLQQVPKDSRGDIIGGVPGLAIVSADYSQIEVRIAAFIARDEYLLRLLEQDDVHTAVASAVFNVPEADVQPRQRKLAKAMTFLLLFGGGVSGFYHYVNMSGGTLSEEAAEKYVYQFFTTFAGLRRMRELAMAKAEGPAPVRIRLPNGAKRILVGYNKRATTILNTMVQGSAAVGIKYGMLEANRRGLTKYLGGQIHDELVAAVPTREAREYGRELADAMVVGMGKILQDTTVKVEVKVGKEWQA